jgi:hypothetical protein
MIRERALKVVLVLVGLLFTAAIYPVVTTVRDGWQANKEDALLMMSLYFTLGIFLLLAARNLAQGLKPNNFAYNPDHPRRSQEA